MLGKRKLTFSDSERSQLASQYQQMMALRSDSNGSAYGEHYQLVSTLRGFGIRATFESSAQVENYVEHVISNGEAPDVY